MPQNPELNSPSETKPALGQLADIEFFRGFAAIALVYLHTVGGTQWGYTAHFARTVVPFFTASAVMFAVVSSLKRNRSIFAYVRTRGCRILIPYVTWSVVYLVFRCCGSAILGGPFPVPKWQWLLSGLSHHLWFLPFIFFVTSITYCTTRWLYRPVYLRLTFGAIFIALGFVSLVCNLPLFLRRLGYPVALSYDVFPVACWVVGLMFLCNNFYPAVIRRKIVSIVLCFLLIAGLAVLVISGRWRFLENLLGVNLLLLALNNTLASEWHGFKRLGIWAYGIYLSHVLFVEGMQDIIGKFDLDVNNFAVCLAIFFIATTLSATLCLVLSKWQWGWAFGVPMQSFQQKKVSI